MRVRTPLVFQASTLILTLAIAAATPARMPAKAPVRIAKLPSVPSAATFEGDVQPFLGKYCVTCHNGADPPGGISLSRLARAEDVLKAQNLWGKVSENIASSHMPPAGAPQPGEAERRRVAGWIEGALSQADCRLRDPGRVTLRRLNRQEYNNTIRDLFGADLHPADEFPSDDVGYGFDNIGDVLSISPLLMEKYLNAAEQVAEAVIIAPESRNRLLRFPVTQLAGTAGSQRIPDGDYEMFTNSEVGADCHFPIEGDYILRVRAYGDQAGPDPARMTFRVDGADIKTVDVRAVKEKPGIYQIRVKITSGTHHISAAFVNDYYKADDPDPSRRDRNLYVTQMAVQGPIGKPAALSAGIRPFISAHAGAANAASVRKLLGDFASRAYRRPVTPEELDRLVRYVQKNREQGASYEHSIQMAVEAVLVSPNFLFRVEVSPNPNDPAAKSRLNDYEMATRLSYFLWSSMPDDRLFALARQGMLHRPAILEAQVHRMLLDPKAHALAANFAGQWLQLRKLSTAAPDPGRFPDFNETLRAAMRTETEMFFTSIMTENHSILDFIDANYTFLNEPLAKHYGISGVAGNNFRRVRLAGDERGGVITQASVLTVTSNPTRTSPVKRGKWILEQILGTPPPPPPPGVAQLDDQSRKELTGATLRERMIQHRQDPACANCHLRMDPLGFGLENYDATGSWRTREGDAPIDSSGTLPSGDTFHGSSELKRYLLTKKDQFAHAFAEKMLTYALGRGIETRDACYVNEIARQTARHEYHFETVVTAVVESDPFRMRRGDGGTIQ